MNTTVEQLRAAKALKASELFTIGADTPPEIIGVLDAYCAQFAAPVKDGDGKQVCIGCDSQMDSFKQMLGVGAAYSWGMVHGEANCTNCGYPARGMHYIKDDNGEELLTLRNVFLAYMPDDQSEVQDA